MSTLKAIKQLDDWTYLEIREQLELEGIDGISELDDEQVYRFAIECLTDY